MSRPASAHPKITTFRLRKGARKLLAQLRYHELFNGGELGVLPSPVTEEEKYRYTSRSYWLIYLLSLASFVPASTSMFHFLASHLTVLWPVMAFWVFTLFYFLVSMVVNWRTKDFDLSAHRALVEGWRPGEYPSVDVFLPTTGEDVAVIRNTWEGVREMASYYPGRSLALSMWSGPTAATSRRRATCGTGSRSHRATSSPSLMLTSGHGLTS